MILRRSTSLIPSSSSSSLRLFLPRPVSLIPPLPTQTSPSHTLPSRSLLPRNASIFFFSTSTAMAAPYETVFAKDAAPRKNLCLFLFFYFSQVHQALTIDFPYNSCRPIRTSIHPSTPPPPPLELTWEKKNIEPRNQSQRSRLRLRPNPLYRRRPDPHRGYHRRENRARHSKR